MHLSKASLSLSGRIIVTPTAKSGALRTRTPEALVILNNFVRVNRAVMCSLRGRSAALRAGLSCCKAKEFIDYLFLQPGAVNYTFLHGKPERRRVLKREACRCLQAKKTRSQPVGPYCPSNSPRHVNVLC